MSRVRPEAIAPAEGEEGDEAEGEQGSAEAESAVETLTNAADEGVIPADVDDETAEPRPSLMNFANTDLLFAGDVVVAGNYHGFNAYDISEPRAPELLSSVVCPGGQGDVSIIGDLLIISVEQTRGRLDCGLQGVAEPESAELYELFLIETKKGLIDVSMSFWLSVLQSIISIKKLSSIKKFDEGVSSSTSIYF